MKKRKYLSLILCVILIINTVFCCTFIAYADDVNWNYDQSTQTLKIYGTGKMTDYDENTVQTLPWYNVKDEIKNVVVTDGITHIGDYAFCRESKLESVTIPNSVTSIGTASIAGCDSLKEITIPDSVESVGNYAWGYDYTMEIVKGFMTYCSFNSPAQIYCIANYVPCNVTIGENDTQTAVCKGKNWQSFWSFTPSTDGIVTWYSVGSQDTYGLVYDASNYSYNTNYSTMATTAKAKNDDGGYNLNFKITLDVQAGHTYLMAAKYNSAAKSSGSFDVCLDFESTQKEFVITDFKNGIAQLKCTTSDETDQLVFKDYIGKDNDLLDVVDDGVINAKDFAKLTKMFK